MQIRKIFYEIVEINLKMLFYYMRLKIHEFMERKWQLITNSIVAILNAYHLLRKMQLALAQLNINNE